MGYLEGLLGAGEQVVRKARRHWITLMGRLLIYGGIAIILFALAGTFLAAGDNLGRLKNVPAALLALFALWLVARAVLAFVRWRNEIYVLTSRRIVQVEGVLNKYTVDSSLDKINDVVLSQSALGRLLGYGDLEILTASEFGVNKLTALARALDFKTDMLNAKESLRAAGGGEDSPGPARGAEQPADLSAMLTELEQMRQQGLVSDEEYEAKRTEILKRM